MYNVYVKMRNQPFHPCMKCSWGWNLAIFGGRDANVRTYFCGVAVKPELLTHSLTGMKGMRNFGLKHGDNELVSIIAHVEDVLLKRASQGTHMAQSKISNFLKSIGFKVAEKINAEICVSGTMRWYCVIINSFACQWFSWYIMLVL